MDNHYTFEIEDILNMYALEAETLYVIHNKSFIKYHYRGYYFVIPVIIITSIGGVLSFNASIQNSEAGQYTIGALNILASIITTIYKFLDYANYESQHRLLSAEYLRLFEEIRSVLLKHPKDRPDAIHYLQKIEIKRQELYDNFSIISDDVKRAFKQKHKDFKTLPLKLNHISTIKIYGRDTPSPIESKTPSCHSVEQFV